MEKNWLKNWENNKINQKELKKERAERGSTLNTLVIMIVLVIILASILFVRTFSNRGIITEAIEADNAVQISKSADTIQMLYLEAKEKSSDDNITLDDFLDYLEQKGIDTTVRDGKHIAEIDGKLYEIKEDENGGIDVSYLDEGTVTEPRIFQIVVTNKTESSITVKPEGNRMTSTDGGEATYRYYIGLTESSLEYKGENKGEEFKFDGLTHPGEYYYIRVEGISEDGGTTNKTIRVLLNPTEIIDDVAPIITISPDGGNYIYSQIGKASIKSQIVASDPTDENYEASGLSELKYAWSSEGSVQPADSAWKNIQSGNVAVKDDCEVGPYYLWVQAKDGKGNTARIVSQVFYVNPNTVDGAQIVLTPSTINPINQDITVTADFGEYLVKDKRIGWGLTLEEAKANAETASSNTITVAENGFVYAEGSDEAGNTKSESIKITNIDKTKPTVGSIVGSEYYCNQGEVVINEILDEGTAGLSGYYYSQVNTPPSADPTDSRWVDLDTKNLTLPARANGTYYFWVIDKAGNISDVATCVVKNIVPRITRVELVDNIVKKGEQVQIVAYVTNANGRRYQVVKNSTDNDYKSINFASEDVTIASIVPETGVASGVGGGKTKINVTVTNYDGTPASVSGQCNLLVTNISYTNEGRTFIIPTKEINGTITKNKAKIQTEVRMSGVGTSAQYIWSDSNSSPTHLSGQTWKNYPAVGAGTVIEGTITGEFDTPNKTYYLWTKIDNRITYVSQGFILKPGTITLTPNITTWTNGKVNVKVAYDDSIMESSRSLTANGDETTHDQLDTFTMQVSLNQKVTATGTDEVGLNASQAEYDVTNIDIIPSEILESDTVAPTGTNPTPIQIKYTSMVVESKITDEASGISRIEWSYKAASAEEWINVPEQDTFTYASNTKSATSRRTISGLVAGTAYNVKVKVTDIAGNTSEQTSTITTRRINIDTNGDGIPDVDIDTDGDGEPDINLDTNEDGKPDVDIDTNGDGEPDVNVDTNGDGVADKNIDRSGDNIADNSSDNNKNKNLNEDTDGDGVPDINIDTDGDGKADLNIDTNGDNIADTNIDADHDGKAELNIDTDRDGKPDTNIDQNRDGIPDLNIDTDGDGKPNVNIDIDGDGKPDVNIDLDGDNIADINIDLDGDGTSEKNIDMDGDGTPDVNVDNRPLTNRDEDGDGTPDINIDTNGDGIPDVNIDTDGNGIPDVNVDANGDGIPDVNIDLDGDNIADINKDTNGDGIADIDIDRDGDKKPDLNIDTDGDGKPNINIDSNKDGDPDVNIDKNGDWKADLNIDNSSPKDNIADINIDSDDNGTADKNRDTNGDGVADANKDTPWPKLNQDTDGDGIKDTNIDLDGDGKPDKNIDTDGEKKKEVNIDTDADGKPDINLDIDGDNIADINIDSNGDGIADLNIDTDNDGNADINIDTNGDGLPDKNVVTPWPEINKDTDGDGIADINIDKDGDGKPDINIDTDGDGIPDLNIHTNGDGIPDINVDTNGDGIADKNIDTSEPRDNIADINVDTDGDGKPDTNIDTDGDGIADKNVKTPWPPINKDTNGDGKPDLNVDTDGDGKPDLNIDTDGDGKPDVNIDTDGDGKPDTNIDTNGDNIPDINIDKDKDGNPDLNIDVDGDGKPDYNIDTDGNGTPDKNVDVTKPTIGNVTGSSSPSNSGTLSVTGISDGSGSGVVGILISKTNTTPKVNDKNWIDFTGTTFTYEVDENRTYYVWVKDKAGNISSVKSAAVSGIVPVIVNSDLSMTAGLIVKKDSTVTFTSTIGNGKTSYKEVNWFSSDTSIATRSSQNKLQGTFKGIAPGTTKVRCEVTNWNGSKAIVESDITVVNVVSFTPNGGTYGIPYDTVNGVSTARKCTIEETASIMGATNSYYQWVKGASTSPNNSNWTKYAQNVGTKITKQYAESEAGSYYLWVKAEDSHGNSVTYKSNEFKVEKSIIEITADIPSAWTPKVVISVRWPNAIVNSSKTLISKGTQERGYTGESLNSVTMQENNQKMVAAGSDASGLNISTATYDINNIDVTAAEVSYNNTTANIDIPYPTAISYDSMTLQASAIDTQSGIAEIKWYYKKLKGASYGNAVKTTSYSGVTTKQTENLSLTGLRQGTAYNIKIEVKDKVGNIATKISTVETDEDLIPPTFTLSNNGGNFAVRTDGTKSTISTKITADDKGGSGLKVLQYQWTFNDTNEPSNWNTFTNGATITRNDAVAGTYYLWLNIWDGAGNRTSTIRSNGFVVATRNITMSYNKAWTNQNVTVTVSYGDGLTKNQKAGFGTTVAKATSAAAASTATSVTATENGYIYAYAQDVCGNTVYTTEGSTSAPVVHVENIERISPTVVFSVDSGNYLLPTTTSYVTNVVSGSLSSTLGTTTTVGKSKVQTAITVSDTGGSGVKTETLKYAWSNSNSTAPTEGWTAFTNGGTITRDNFEAEANWYLWVQGTDNAGNAVKKTVAGANPVSGKYQIIKAIIGLKEKNDKIDWVNTDLTIEATYPAVLTQKSNLTSNGASGTYTINGSTSAVVKSNQTITAVAKDSSGLNTATATYQVKNIDKTNPAIVSFTPNGGTYARPTVTTYSTVNTSQSDTASVSTNTSYSNAKIQSVVTVKDDGGSNLKTRKYGWNQSSSSAPGVNSMTAFTSGATISKDDINAEGSWYLWIYLEDYAGNTLTTKSNEFKVQSGTISLAAKDSLIKWTNTNVQINATYAAALPSNKRSNMTCTGTSGTDYAVNGSSYVTVMTNGKAVTATATDASGLNTSTATYTVNNIDKSAPSASITGTNGGNFVLPTTVSYSSSNTTGTKSTSNAKLTTTLTTGDTGGSGIRTQKYAWVKDSANAPADSSYSTNISSGTAFSKTDCGAGTYYLWAKVVDYAGTTTTINSGAYVVAEAAIPLKANVTGWTSGSVKVSLNTAYPTTLTKDKAITSTGAASSYTKNGTTDITVTGNQTVTFTGKDSMGNQSSSSYQVTNIDKTSPTIPTSAWTISDITKSQIKAKLTNIEDTASGLNRIEWYITTNTSNWGSAKSTTNLSGTKASPEYTFTNLSEYTNYYIKVIIYDNATTNSSTANSTTQQYTATVRTADETKPTITIKTNSQTTYSKTATVAVDLEDSYSGLAASGNSVKYGWSTTKEAAPTSWTTVNLTAGSVKKETINATASGLTGKYYLWVQGVTLKDVSGNNQTGTVKSTGQFYFDNTEPQVVTAISKKSTTSTSITAGVTIKDPDSGLKSIQWQKLVGSNWTNDGNAETISGTSNLTKEHTFSSLTEYTEYSMRAIIKDQLDNSKTTTTLKQKTNDVTKPNITELKATEITKNTITASVTTNDTGSGLKTIDWYITTNTSNWGTKVKTETVTGASTTKTYQFTGLSEFTNYYVKAVVTDQETNSQEKATAAIQTKDGTAPVITNVSASSSSKSQITLSATISDVNGSGIDHVEWYYRKGTSGNYTKDGNNDGAAAGKTAATNISHTFTGLDENTSYQVYVKVVDKQSNNASSDAKTVTTLDQTPPGVTFGTNGGTFTVPVTMTYTSDNKTGTKSVGTNGVLKTTVTVTDANGLQSLKYLWKSGTDTPADSAITNTFTSGNEIKKSDVSAAGTWKLWILATDNSSEHNVTKTSATFTVVESAVTLAGSGDSSWTSSDVTVTASYGDKLTTGKSVTGNTGTQNTDWTVSGNTVTVKTNNIQVKAVGSDAMGNQSIALYTVNKINKGAPSVAAGNVSITPTGKQNSKNMTVTGGTAAVSGVTISKWAYIKGDTKPTKPTSASTTWYNISSNASFTRKRQERKILDICNGLNRKHFRWITSYNVRHSRQSRRIKSITNNRTYKEKRNSNINKECNQRRGKIIFMVKLKYKYSNSRQ